MASTAIKFTTLSETAKRPEIIYPLALGMHIFASENRIIDSGRRAFVETGIKVSVPPGYYAQIVGCYSMTTMGVYVGSFTFDGKYEGPIRILVDNKSRYELAVAIGEKIAEMIILPLDPPVITYQNLFDNININDITPLDLAFSLDQDQDINLDI